MDYVGVIFSLIIFLLNCLNPQNAIHYYAIIFMAVTVIRLLSKKSPYMALSDISPLIVGLLYIPTLVSFQWFLKRLRMAVDFISLWRCLDSRFLCLLHR
ncbi:MAG: hypothetical protein RMI30_07590 [Thermodesulfovibrio sp.]|nr:hypothetical protein [Thermodesulfovibrio sp.]